MNLLHDELIAIVPYFTSIIISISLAIYAWSQYKVSGTKPLIVMTVSMALATTGYICELLLPELRAKIFWDNFQWCIHIILYLSMFIFAASFTGYIISKPLRILLIFFTTCLLLLVSIGYGTGISNTGARLIRIDTFTRLDYDFNLLNYIIVIFNYLMVIIGIILLVKHFIVSHYYYRRQIAIILLGYLITTGLSFVTNFGIFNDIPRDLSPFTFSICNLIVGWGLFRYRLLDVVPVAYHTVIASVQVGVMVLDIKNRVIDLNPAVQQMFEIDASKAIGNPINRILNFWEDVKAQLYETAPLQIEVNLVKNQQPVYYDLQISPLVDHRGVPTGKVVVIHDITQRKKAEAQKEKLINELEDALANVKNLKGLLPICACCKKIRDDHGYWHQVENYLRLHSEVDFSHGLCPDCYELYCNKKIKQENPTNHKN